MSVDDPQSTRESLLVRLGDGQDLQAWNDFVDLYSPVVYGFARRHGLQDADAADLVQEVLRSVARSLGSYDRDKGRFRSWLMAVVRRRLTEFWAARRRTVAGSGDTQVQGCLSPTGTEGASASYRETVQRRSIGTNS